MKELLDKFYAGTATPEEEAQLLRSADSLPAGPDRDLLQALAAMQRQAAISKMLDNAAAAEAAPKRRIQWPYWIGSLAMAACILLLVLPREAAPVEMAEVKQPAVVVKPQPALISNPSKISKSSRISRVSRVSNISSFSEEGPLPVVIEEDPLPDLLDTPAPDLLYAESLPEPDPESEPDDELIILSSPSLIAREYSTTLIADATPATTHSPLTTHHSPLTLSLFGQTLGDPDADPFAQRSLFAN